MVKKGRADTMKTYILHLSDSEYVVLDLEKGKPPKASFVDEWEGEAVKMRVTVKREGQIEMAKEA